MLRVPEAVSYQIGEVLDEQQVTVWFPERGKPIPRWDGKRRDDPFSLRPEFETPIVPKNSIYAIRLLDSEGRELLPPRRLSQAVLLPATLQMVRSQEKPSVVPATARLAPLLADSSPVAEPPASPLRSEASHPRPPVHRTPGPLAHRAQEALKLFAELAERVREVPEAVHYRLSSAANRQLVPDYLPAKGQPLPRLDGRVSDEPFAIQPEFEPPYVAVTGLYAVQLLDKDGREVKLPRSLFRGIVLPKWPPEDSEERPAGLPPGVGT